MQGRAQFARIDFGKLRDSIPKLGISHKIITVLSRLGRKQVHFESASFRRVVVTELKVLSGCMTKASR